MRHSNEYEAKRSSKRLLALSRFIGAVKATPALRTRYKKKVKSSIRKKYGRK